MKQDDQEANQVIDLDQDLDENDKSDYNELENNDDNLEKELKESEEIFVAEGQKQHFNPDHDV